MEGARPSRACFFCLSKTRTAPEAAQQTDSAATTLLKMSQLRARASAAGARPAQLAAAEDDPLPKEAMVALVEALEAGADEEPQRREAVAALRAELATCAPSVLRARAIGVGISQDQLAEADDAEEPARRSLSSSSVRRAAVGPLLGPSALTRSGRCFRSCKGCG